MSGMRFGVLDVARAISGDDSWQKTVLDSIYATSCAVSSLLSLLSPIFSTSSLSSPSSASFILFYRLLLFSGLTSS